MARGRSQETTLAAAWRSGARRMLFFTYRFDFRWFHDCVLNQARRHARASTQIDVLASRFADDTYAHLVRGDLYSLEEWMKWKTKLRISYVPVEQHLFHNKFILLETANGEIKLGVGSSNLTYSGWSRNLETWTWSGSAGLEACAGFLRHLASLRKVDRALVDPWIRRIGKRPPDAWPWLWGAKSQARRRIFQALRARIEHPKVLRIVSPYFDERSSEVLQELLSETRLQKPRLELWIDGSGFLARPSDYRVAGDLANAYGPTCVIRKVMSKASARALPSPLPLHAKVIEVENSDGTVARVLGSANFTGAAWLQGWNTESIQIERSRHALPLLLGEGTQLANVKSGELAGLSRQSSATDEPGTGKLACIYWVAFDEMADPRVLTVCYTAPSPLKRASVVGMFDKARDTLPNRGTRDAIVRQFNDRQNWKQLSDQGGLLKIAYQTDTSVPELARVVLHFVDGRTLEAPIEIATPDFSLRDDSTGIPASPVDALLGRSVPIVPPRTRKTLAELAKLDDEYDEELTAPPEDKLGADPDYRRVPLAVKIAQGLGRKLENPEEVRRIRKLCQAGTSVQLGPGESAVLEAVKKLVADR